MGSRSPPVRTTPHPMGHPRRPRPPAQPHDHPDPRAAVHRRPPRSRPPTPRHPAHRLHGPKRARPSASPATSPAASSPATTTCGSSPPPTGRHWPTATAAPSATASPPPRPRPAHRPRQRRCSRVDHQQGGCARLPLAKSREDLGFNIRSRVGPPGLAGRIRPLTAGSRGWRSGHRPARAPGRREGRVNRLVGEAPLPLGGVTRAPRPVSDFAG